MGAEFFSPAHWPLFVRFVRALECPEEAHEDDLPASADGSERSRKGGADRVNGKAFLAYS
jgi:hypothetical protein